MKHKIVLCFLLCLSSITMSQNASYRMLVGSYTRNTSSEGIYALFLDKKGKLQNIQLLAVSDNPSYLCLSPDGKYVYAVNETGVESHVSSFCFDSEKPALTLLNQVSVNGDPCYITATEKHVFTANYSSGSLSVFKRNSDASLTNAVQIIEHRRVSFGRNKFGPSNAHQIKFSPDGKWVLATNLATDRVFTYSYNPDSNEEVLKYIDEFEIKKHSGPRHITFSDDSQFVYVLSELDGTLSVLSINNEGRLTLIQETTVVRDQSKKTSAADIHLSPDGKFLYATNRGEANTITCFRILKDGTLNVVSEYSTGGKAPRNFTISPNGKFLFVGNQHTDNISVFRRNKCSGKIKLVRNDIKLGAPVCLLLYY